MALDWFFGTFDDITVITETDPDNRASIGTSESIGFRFRGVVDGKYTCEMSEREWLNLA